MKLCDLVHLILMSFNHLILQFCEVLLDFLPSSFQLLLTEVTSLLSELLGLFEMRQRGLFFRSVEHLKLLWNVSFAFFEQCETTLLLKIHYLLYLIALQLVKKDFELGIEPRIELSLLLGQIFKQTRVIPQNGAKLSHSLAANFVHLSLGALRDLILYLIVVILGCLKVQSLDRVLLLLVKVGKVIVRDQLGHRNSF